MPVVGSACDLFISGKRTFAAVQKIGKLAPCRHSLRRPLRSAMGRKQQRTLNRCRQQLPLQPLHVAHSRAFRTSTPPNALSLP
jgi:hypothetical protein